MLDRTKEVTREIPRRRLFVLGGHYQVECSSGSPVAVHLPLKIERKVRELTLAWGADPETCAEARCVLSSGTLMRVFRLVGDDTYRIGVSLEFYRERAGSSASN